MSTHEGDVTDIGFTPVEMFLSIWKLDGKIATVDIIDLFLSMIEFIWRQTNQNSKLGMRRWIDLKNVKCHLTTAGNQKCHAVM